MVKKQKSYTKEVIEPKQKKQLYSFPEYGITVKAHDLLEAKMLLNSKLKGVK